MMSTVVVKGDNSDESHACKIGMTVSVYRRAMNRLVDCEVLLMEYGGYHDNAVFSMEDENDKPTMKEVQKVARYHGMDNNVIFFEFATRPE